MNRSGFPALGPFGWISSPDSAQRIASHPSVNSGSPSGRVESRLAGLRAESEAGIVELLSAVAFGLVEPEGDGFKVPSPRLLDVGRELHRAGVPIPVILEELTRLRADMERVADRFVELAAQPVLAQFPEVLAGDTVPAELQALVARLRPLAGAAVEAELARAMRLRAGDHLAELIRRHIGEGPADAEGSIA